MSRLLTYIVNHVTALLPETRCYRLKAWLYRLCGYRIARSSRIVSSVRIWGDMDLRVGEHTFIGYECLIVGGVSTIDIGDQVDIGPRVSVISGTHIIDMNGGRAAGCGESRDIAIEDGAWVGACCTILGGVRIGAKAVIAAGSVVTRDIPPEVVAAGVPCRPVKRWNRELRSWDGIEPPPVPRTGRGR
jgi:maltose O-acetyltransferase